MLRSFPRFFVPFHNFFFFMVSFVPLHPFLVHTYIHVYIYFSLGLFFFHLHIFLTAFFSFFFLLSYHRAINNPLSDVHYVVKFRAKLIPHLLQRRSYIISTLVHIYIHTGIYRYIIFIKYLTICSFNFNIIPNSK